MRRLALVPLLLATPAHAIVGGAPAEPEVAAGAAMLVSNRGSFCSAAVLAPKLLLTAAHCVVPGAQYRLLTFLAGQPQLSELAGIALHPGYDSKAYRQRTFTIDLALVALKTALPGSRPLPLPAAAEPGQAGAAYRIAGFGLASSDPHTGGTLRQADLVGIEPVSRVQLRLDDPAGDTVGSCQGDSGGPVVRRSDGVLVGVLASAVGQNGRGCGGRTGVALLGTALDWIRGTAARMGSPLR